MDFQQAVSFQQSKTEKNVGRKNYFIWSQGPKIEYKYKSKTRPIESSLKWKIMYLKFHNHSYSHSMMKQKTFDLVSKRYRYDRNHTKSQLSTQHHYMKTFSTPPATSHIGDYFPHPYSFHSAGSYCGWTTQ